ncbi:hypothetical protein FQR65_LT17532 [Abscondita terminalis]|nr:hypothetical protein FQR65_LT17532 [Abscondita terminalis]
MPLTKERLRFTMSDDLYLLREVLAINPYEDSIGWKNVLAAVIKGTSKTFTLRAVKEHLQYILMLWAKEDRDNIRKSGTEEEYNEKEVLLQQVTDLSREFRGRSKTNLTPNKITRDVQSIGAEIRNTAIIQEEPAGTSSDLIFEFGDTAEIPSDFSLPKTATGIGRNRRNKTTSIKSAGLQFLREKQLQDRTLKEKEIDLENRKIACEVCKGRWKNIRDNYMKHKRKKLGTGSSASERPPKWHLYKFLGFLGSVSHERQSINNTGIQNNTDTVCHEEVFDTMDSQNDNDFQEDDASLLSPTQNEFSDSDTAIKRLRVATPDSRSTTPNSGRASVINKNKIMENLEQRSKQRLELLEHLTKQKEKEDDVDLFMRSIAMTVKQMPAHKIARAKMNILQVVTELQLSNDLENPSDLENTYILTNI